MLMLRSGKIYRPPGGGEGGMNAPQIHQGEWDFPHPHGRQNCKGRQNPFYRVHCPPGRDECPSMDRKNPVCSVNGRFWMKITRQKSLYASNVDLHVKSKPISHPMSVYAFNRSFKSKALCHITLFYIHLGECDSSTQMQSSTANTTQTQKIISS